MERPSACASASNLTRIRIQGFVPTNNTVLDTAGIIPAAFVALDEINANDDLLPNYTLVLDFSDTRVRRGKERRSNDVMYMCMY